MRCYYTYDCDKNKVLVPGCMAVAHSGDIEDCTCSLGLIPANIDRKDYKRTVALLRDEIEGLEKEITHLRKIIENENK